MIKVILTAKRVGFINESMIGKTRQHLKIIRFEGEMLPDWAQLFDLAARSCLAPSETQQWFSRFTHSSGMDDARTIIAHGEILRSALQTHKAEVLASLQKTPDEEAARRILAAWQYALDTILQQAAGKSTCSWMVEGTEDPPEDGYGDGEITLRRV